MSARRTAAVAAVALAAACGPSAPPVPPWPEGPAAADTARTAVLLAAQGDCHPLDAAQRSAADAARTAPTALDLTLALSLRRHAEEAYGQCSFRNDQFGGLPNAPDPDGAYDGLVLAADVLDSHRT